MSGGRLGHPPRRRRGAVGQAGLGPPDGDSELVRHTTGESGRLAGVGEDS